MSCEIQPARRSQQCNTMQYHMIQCNYMYKTMQYHKTQLNSMQYHTMDAMQYNGIICIFGPKNSHFRQLGPYNGLPTSQTACRPAKRPPTGKPKVSGVTSGYEDVMIPLSQMIWLRSVTDHPSEPKKGGLYGCSVRKSDFWATFGPKKKTKILCWPRCTAGLGAAAAGFSACNCLFDSHNCLLTSLILDPYYKLNWPKRASAVYWLFGTLLYPWENF